MLILDPNKNTRSGFRREGVALRFLEKYKPQFQALYVEKHHIDTPERINYDLLTEDGLRNASKDHGLCKMKIMATTIESKNPFMIGVVAPLFTQCGTVVIKCYDHPDSKDMPMIEEICAGMNYTTALISFTLHLISSKEEEKIDAAKKMGYVPLTRFVNGRTSSKIIIAIKQLQPCQ